MIYFKYKLFMKSGIVIKGKSKVKKDEADKMVEKLKDALQNNKEGVFLTEDIIVRFEDIAGVQFL